MIPLDAARRLLLGAQGLTARPDRKTDLYRLIHGLGFVQIDSINVLERAHHLTLWSRLDSYRPEHLKALLEDRRLLFEHWTHDASLIPTEFFPYWRFRGLGYGNRRTRSAWWHERLGGEPERLLAAVREEVEQRGPVASKHLGEGGGAGAWWGWKPEKAALEHLWRSMELAVHSRRGFEKVYDLTERVFPHESRLPIPTAEEHRDWACAQALQRLGVATPAELAAFWGGLEPEEAREWARTAPDRGLAVPVQVEGLARPTLAVPDWEERANLRLPRRTRLLSPFDPVVRDRKRLLRLFGFDYRFEAFVPEPQRRYGYYVLPVLEGDRFVARLDAKLHRAWRRLEVKGLWWETGVRVTPARRAGLDEALQRLAAFVGAETVSGDA